LNKLKYFDVPDAQIAELAKTRQLTKTLPVVAPISGFVIEKNIVAGQMVDAGMKLYRLADLGIVWVIAQVYEQDLPFVKLGQEAIVKVASLPDREFRGRVTFVYPTVDEKTRTARVRLEFENPGYFLKPGMFVSAVIHAQLEDSAVLVPESAVLRSGARNTVFVALDGGKFEARDVALGLEAESGMIQVASGLTAGERIVTSGQFLLDSESQLREAIEKMRGSTSVIKSETIVTPSTNEVATAIPATAEMNASVYVCPMPEHVSIVYDHAGKCPVCGMTLVSVTHSALEKNPAGRQCALLHLPDAGARQRPRRQARQMSIVRHDADPGDVNAGPCGEAALHLSDEIRRRYSLGPTGQVSEMRNGTGAHFHRGTRQARRRELAEAASALKHFDHAYRHLSTPRSKGCVSPHPRPLPGPCHVPGWILLKRYKLLQN
jgi:hypothetical protein